MVVSKTKKRTSFQIAFVFLTFRPNVIMISKKHIQENETICGIFEGGPEATASFASPNIHHWYLGLNFKTSYLTSEFLYLTHLNTYETMEQNISIKRC